MKQFKPMEESHPYVKWAQGEMGTDFTLAHYWQPAKALWPIYSIRVWREKDGIQYSTSIKCRMDSWWEGCGKSMYSALPDDLALQLASMIKDIVKDAK